eukprot:985249-Pyramimonas_sp.AAC.1
MTERASIPPSGPGRESASFHSEHAARAPFIALQNRFRARSCAPANWRHKRATSAWSFRLSASITSWLVRS